MKAPIEDHDTKTTSLKTPSPKPPDGEITAKAILTDASSIIIDTGKLDLTDALNSRVIEGTLYVTLVASDPYTGQPTLLTKVPVERNAGTMLEGLREGQQFILKSPSYELFLKRETSRMVAIPSHETPVMQNMSIPTPVKYPDPSGNGVDTKSSTAICKRYDDAEEKAKGYMGVINHRSDLTVVQGKENGRSPGLLVQQSDGKLYLFDVTGQQHIGMDSQSIAVQTAYVKFGNANIGHTTPGIPVPMIENKVLDVVPNGTILTPQPRLLINFLEAASLIMNVTDYIRLGKLCYEATKLIMSGYSGRALEQKVAAANISASEEFYYGNQVEELFPYIDTSEYEADLIKDEVVDFEDTDATQEQFDANEKAELEHQANLLKAIAELKKSRKGFFRSYKVAFLAKKYNISVKELQKYV
jgi:hypothetical protein